MSIHHLRGKRVVVIGALALALAAISLAASVMIGPFGIREPGSPEAAAFAAKGAPKLKAAYAEWVKQHDAQGGDRYVAISLGYWKALSASYTTAHGLAKLNLLDGAVTVTVSGLATGEWDVWLVDNRPGPGRSIRPEASDATIRVGRLVQAGDTAKLEAELGAAAFKAFHVDLVVVAPAGGDPGTTGLLFGSPSLFQRLYTALRSPTLLMASDFAAQPGIRVERRWASLFGAPAAEAEGIFVDADVVANALVRTGANLFINERFNGNGRTCATCHRAEDNFTITTNFIASLPDDDALFVAEFTPALAFDPLGKKFEVPVLMRKHGLIVENVDGMGDLVNRFTMRGVPHTLGLRQSLETQANDGTTKPPNQRTGWSGDGAPGGGTLRDFATGAVTQHFPKTLDRQVPADFRMPTDAELDAMEAFQLTLGRQVDLVLPLNFKDAQVARGQVLFRTAIPQGGGGCNACHFNAGANASFGGGNRNFNTGVENQPDRPQVLTLLANNIDLTPDITTNIIPRDGGFGQAPGNGPLPNPALDPTGFGNGTFNTPPVVEAADTGPFFHDNSVATIEGVVEFYNSQAFADANQGGIRLNLAATQVEAIAAFLRAINALENIRSAIEAATAARAVSNSNPQASDQLLKQAIGDAQDAMTVLGTRALHPAAVASLQRAVVAFGAASVVNGFFSRVDRALIDRGLARLAEARADIVQ